MEYAKLGDSDLKVSRVCMGFGDSTNGMHTWTLPDRGVFGMAFNQCNLPNSRRHKDAPVEGAVKSVDLKLRGDDIDYLEGPYVAHDLVGVMADNQACASDDDKVWQKHTKDRI